MVGISKGFKPRENRDVRDYVIRHFFREDSETVEIYITAAARDHILSKGGTVYLLDTKPVGLCCGRVAFEPQLTLGVPAKPDEYNLNIIDDIKVFIPKRFSVPYPLTIDVKRLFGCRTLRLNGWRLI